jgi:hypothetical protein
MRDPGNSLRRAFTSAVRSSIFFAALVSSYQAQVCVHRNLRLPDSKYNYYLFGILSGLTVLLESKHRRAELAMFVLPKAWDSLFSVLMKRRWMIRIPGFTYIMFGASMGTLMAFYATESEAISPLVLRFLKHFIGKAK